MQISMKVVSQNQWKLKNKKTNFYILIKHDNQMNSIDCNNLYQCLNAIFYR